MQHITIRPNAQRILLVDLGYLLFYRYHATTKNLAFRGVDTGSLTDDDIISYYKTHLDEQLKKTMKKYKVDYTSVFFCKDARQATVWRKDLYPDYKATRGVATDLVRKLKRVMYDTVSQYGTLFGVDRLEADDMIYLTAKAILKLKPEVNIYILANDRDYLQMIENDNMHLVDASSKSVKGSGNCHIDLWIKTLMGDKSDNIPPVCKGVGKKTAEKLAHDNNERNAFIDKKGCRDALERNMTLIHFDRIPQQYRDAFNSAYAFVIGV